MLLKVMYYKQKDGKYAAVTRYEGHVKAWFSDSVINLKQKAGSWLGRAHRDGGISGISRLKFFEGYPNDDTVWLLQEPERRRRRRLSSFQNTLVREQPKQSTTTKEVQDNTEYLYKVEDGHLKIFSKTLVGEYKVSNFSQK